MPEPERERRRVCLLAAVLAVALLPCGCGFEAAPPAPALRPPSKPFTGIELAYASGSPSQKLDVYLPHQGAGPFPVVVWMHGGGLRVGDKRVILHERTSPPPRPAGRNGPYQAQVPDIEALNAMGFAVVSLNYRLGPDMWSAALPALRDAKAAIRFLRANASTYNLDGSRIAAWGNSAGGYLAAMLGTTGDQATDFDDPALGNADVSSAVQAVIVWFGAEDRLPGRFGLALYIPGARTLPPFLIANGDADPVISPAQARRLHEALLEAGGTSTLSILPGAGHEDPAFTATQMKPALEFLQRALGR
jgi:acetyl esterase/lipase